MAIKTVCPDCDRAYNLADTMAGKSVKCKGCGKSFTVGGTPAGNGVATKAENGVASKPPSSAPAPNGVAAKPSNGKAKANPLKVTDDDAPARPAKKKGGGGVLLWVMGGLAGVACLALLVCGGGAVGGYFLFFHKKADNPPPVVEKKEQKPDGENPGGGDPTPGASKVTQANYNQLKSRMTQAEVENLLGKADKTVDPVQQLAMVNVGSPAPDFDKVRPRLSAATWNSGADWIGIVYVDGKVLAVMGAFNKAFFEKPDRAYMQEVAGTSEPPPTRTTVTKAKFEQIKGGMTSSELAELLGPPTVVDMPPDKFSLPLVSDKGRMNRWQDRGNLITVAFNPDLKATRWTGFIDGQRFEQKADAFFVKGNPDTPPAPPSDLVTKENYEKIKGGMSEADLIALLGKITNPNNGQTDEVSAKYDKIRVNVWSNGKDIVRVTLCDGKTARWVGIFNGDMLPAKTDDAFVLLKKDNPDTPPKPENTLTKENYEKIKGGMTVAEVKAILGKATTVNAGLDQEASKYDKAHCDIWGGKDGQDYISVTFCDGKAAHWTAAIGKKQLPSHTDQAFVILKGGNPKPDPNTKLTKAYYDTILVGKTTSPAVERDLGKPTKEGKIGKPGDKGFRLIFTWIDGNAEILIHCDPAKGGVITVKDSKNLK